MKQIKALIKNKGKRIGTESRNLPYLSSAIS